MLRSNCEECISAGDETVEIMAVSIHVEGFQAAVDVVCGLSITCWFKYALGFQGVTGSS